MTIVVEAWMVAAVIAALVIVLVIAGLVVLALVRRTVAQGDARVGRIEDDVQALRTWRHDTIAPCMVDLQGRIVRCETTLGLPIELPPAATWIPPAQPRSRA